MPFVDEFGCKSYKHNYRHFIYCKYLCYIGNIILLISRISNSGRKLYINKKVGCLSLFDFMFSNYANLWLNEESYKILHLFEYEGIMAVILILLHFVSLFLTLFSLLQPCEENCIKPKCTSNSDSSHASERE